MASPSVYFSWIEASSIGRVKRFDMDGVAYPEWPISGMEIEPYTTSIQICSDDIDGVYVAWICSNAYNRTIKVSLQYIKAIGEYYWTNKIVLWEDIDHIIGTADSLNIVNDGHNGCIVTWRVYPYHVHVPVYYQPPKYLRSQRVTPVGTQLWTNGGVEVLSQDAGGNLVVVPDLVGGCFISIDTISGYSSIIKVNALGQIWVAGHPTWLTASDVCPGSIVPLSDGGCVYANTHQRGISNAYEHIARFDINGTILWDREFGSDLGENGNWPGGVLSGFPGIAILGERKDKILCVYGIGNNYVAVIDVNTGTTITYPISLTDLGIATGTPKIKFLITDTLGHVYWGYKTTFVWSGQYTHNVTRFNTLGAVEWTYPQYYLSEVEGGYDRGDPSMFADTTGGVIITTGWDVRTGVGKSLHAQRFNIKGKLCWGNSGNTISTSTNLLTSNRGCISGGVGVPADWPPGGDTEDIPDVTSFQSHRTLDIHYNKLHLKQGFN